MSTLCGIRKYAIEGENARKVYDAVSKSYTFRTYSDYLKMSYDEDRQVLFLEENWDNYPRFGDYVLPFLIGEDFYWLDYMFNEESWTTNDEEGRYFTIPADADMSVE